MSGEITAPWPVGTPLYLSKRPNRVLGTTGYRDEATLLRYEDHSNWRLIIYRFKESQSAAPLMVQDTKPTAWAVIRDDLTYLEALDLALTIEPMGFSLEGAGEEPRYWAPDAPEMVDPLLFMETLDGRLAAVKRGERIKTYSGGVSLPRRGPGVGY